MLTCEETAQLVSEGLDRNLRFRERLTLRLHLLRCDLCTRYARQIKFLQRACADAGEEQLTETAELDAAARERIRERLHQRPSEQL